MSEEDPYSLSDDEDEETGSSRPGGTESKNMADLRKYARLQEKARKEAEASLAELQDFKKQVEAEKREAQIASAFKENGLNEKHAKLFAVLNPDVEVTADLVSSFAQEYDLKVTASDDGTIDAAAPADPVPASGFKPVITSDPTAGIGVYTHEQVTEMLSRGEIEAVNKIFKEGRVAPQEVPWTVQSG